MRIRHTCVNGDYRVELQADGLEEQVRARTADACEPCARRPAEDVFGWNRFHESDDRAVADTRESAADDRSEQTDDEPKCIVDAQELKGAEESEKAASPRQSDPDDFSHVLEFKQVLTVDDPDHAAEHRQAPAVSRAYIWNAPIRFFFPNFSAKSCAPVLITT